MPYVSAYKLPASTGMFLGSATVANGRYTIAHLPVGSVELQAWAEVRTPTCRSTFLVKTVTLVAGANEHDLVFTIPGSITGRVINDANGAVADEMVEVCDVVGTTTCVNWQQFEFTGADGRYRARRPPRREDTS